MDERIDGCARCSARGKEQMDVPYAHFAASVHLQSPAQSTKPH